MLVSGDLIDWIETTATSGSVTDNGDGTETVTFRDTTPLSGSANRFIKLQVSQF